MTEEIDLDAIEVESEEEQHNSGDWFWRGEGDPDDEPAPEPAAAPDDEAAPAGDTEATAEGDATEPDSEADASPAGGAVPHVPRENKDKPVGIPVEGGGAGGAAAADAGDAEDVAQHPDADAEAEASGPHGGGIDDMTTAFTYEAVKRLADPQLSIRDAEAWSDWIGIVGDVETYVISSFQREHGVDVDFFSGSGQSAGDRLGDIDKHSMFFAERMVVVGLPEEEAIAEAADWEFVPLSEAAEKADWELTDPE